MKNNIILSEALFYFWKMPPEVQQNILALMDPNQQQAFLNAAGFMRIITDKEYHDKIMSYTMRVYLEDLKNEL